MPLRNRFIAALLAVALFAGACGGSDDGTAESAVDAGAAAQESTSSADAEEPAAEPTLVVSTVTGGQIDLGSLEGQDTVLWFWAPW